jgi:hypothetical protein
MPCLECVTYDSGGACYLSPPSPLGDFSPQGTFKCLRRILLCAWSTRQRTCFLIRRAPCFASSRATSARCRAGRASLSRTGSSSYATRVSGSSAYVDSLTNKLRHRSHPRRCAAAMGCGPDPISPARASRRNSQIRCAPSAVTTMTIHHHHSYGPSTTTRSIHICRSPIRLMAYPRPSSSMRLMGR